MAGWSQNRRGSGIWKLTDRLSSSSVHVSFMHDDGGRHGVMMEVPFGGHPVAVIQGWPLGPFGNRHRANSRTTPRCPCLTRPVVARLRIRGLTLMLDSAVRECDESRGTRYSERHSGPD
jgi:hypothetical protein